MEKNSVMGAYHYFTKCTNLRIKQCHELWSKLSKDEQLEWEVKKNAYLEKVESDYISQEARLTGERFAPTNSAAAAAVAEMDAEAVAAGAEVEEADEDEDDEF